VEHVARLQAPEVARALLETTSARLGADAPPLWEDEPAWLQQEAGAAALAQEEANERALAGFATKQQAIAAQQQLCRRWDNLHLLIGSADGKKFRNFAQGLTFDVVIAHANRQLRKMSDRYLLIRDVEQNLELNVIDAYQAGMVRSTKNLSGG
jgi:exonuclease SbcC